MQNPVFLLIGTTLDFIPSVKGNGFPRQVTKFIGYTQSTSYYLPLTLLSKNEGQVFITYLLAQIYRITPLSIATNNSNNTLESNARYKSEQIYRFLMNSVESLESEK